MRTAAWREPELFWPSLTEATAHLPAPVAVIDRPALRHNALDLLVRAGGCQQLMQTRQLTLDLRR